ncbi:MAG: hypothetical protein ACJ735_00150 [Actinomycetes bacterium]
MAFEDPKHALKLRITTAKPRTVQHALASYAHGPANGEYLLVDMIVQNLSASGFALDPTHFVFTTTAGHRLTVNSGNAPYSGASHVLDPTYLVAGASEHGPLIYDTPKAHGHIVLTSGGRAACTWTL